MIDIFSLKVEEIASKIKNVQLTSVEVCEKYIEKINKVYLFGIRFNKFLQPQETSFLTIVPSGQQVLKNGS